MRRWLAAGAASVGLGAALLGFSLTDAQVGVAAADTTDQSSASAPSDRSDDDGASTEESRAAQADADDDDDSADTDAEETETDVADVDVEDTDEPAESESDADEADEAPTGKRASLRAQAAAEESETPDPETVSEEPDEPATFAAPAGTSTTLETLADRKQEDVAKAIAALMAAAQAWIAGLPVETRVKDDLTTTVNFLRNTFFNQDPTIDPVQISGQLDGPVTGKINVVDPEGDKVTLRMNRRPQHGTVALNPDGTYTYTPAAGFNGVDTFTVSAIDSGMHVNVLDLFGRPGSSSGVLVNQGAIKFDFRFIGDVAWSDAAKAAVRSSGDRLVTYFMVDKPVTLTYKMIGNNTGFASGGSNPINEGPGFHRTVVQNKIITGIDSNGSAVDGDIDYDLTANWAFGDTVAPDQFDFIGTTMHELMHSFGFGSLLLVFKERITRTNWTTFDSFIVTGDDVPPFRSDRRWNRAYDANLTGGNSGIYFNGTNAVKANGGNLVPLYTPPKWDPGSSITHLDDVTYTGADTKMMNAYTGTGPGVRTLSALELGILQDLGYRVATTT